MFSLSTRLCISLATAVSSDWRSAERVYNSQSLGVVAKLNDIWIVTCPTPLPLATKELFQRILTYIVTEECQIVVFDFRKGEHKLDESNE